jgi:hypothetical protein
MGIEYFVLAPEQKKAYELGKGHWYDLQNANGKFKKSKIVKSMQKRCLLIWHGMNAEQGPVADAYIRKIGKELFNFCQDAGWKVQLWSDGGDLPEFHREYILVGSRYRDETFPWKCWDVEED